MKPRFLKRRGASVFIDPIQEQEGNRVRKM